MPLSSSSLVSCSDKTFHLWRFSSATQTHPTIVSRIKPSFSSQLLMQGVPGEYARLRENVPYVKVHRYNPKHLYPKLKIMAREF